MKRSGLTRKTPLKSTSTLKRGAPLKQGRSTGKPTKAEERRFHAIQMTGCVVCLVYFKVTSAPEIHHLTVGGHHGQLRRGHRHTIGLCPWHHRGVWQQSKKLYRDKLGPSYALEPNAFREQFGDDETLLTMQDEIVATVLTP